MLTKDQENICRLIEHYEDPQHICLVLEYVDGGDLLDHITEYPSPNGGGLRELLSLKPEFELMMDQRRTTLLI